MFINWISSLIRAYGCTPSPLISPAIPFINIIHTPSPAALMRVVWLWFPVCKHPGFTVFQFINTFMIYAVSQFINIFEYAFTLTVVFDSLKTFEFGFLECQRRTYSVHNFQLRP